MLKRELWQCQRQPTPPCRSFCSAVVARGLFGWGDAATETVTAEAATSAQPSTASADEQQPAVLLPAIDMQPLAGPFGAEPPQALIDAQLAHMIESPELDDFEEVRGRAFRGFNRAYQHPHFTLQQWHDRLSHI